MDKTLPANAALHYAVNVDGPAWAEQLAAPLEKLSPPGVTLGKITCAVHTQGDGRVWQCTGSFEGNADKGQLPPGAVVIDP